MLENDGVGSHHASELRETDDSIAVPVHHPHHLLRLLHAADLTQDELHLVRGDAAVLVLAEDSEGLPEINILLLVRFQFLCQG